MNDNDRELLYLIAKHIVAREDHNLSRCYNSCEMPKNYFQDHREIKKILKQIVEEGNE